MESDTNRKNKADLWLHVLAGGWGGWVFLLLLSLLYRLLRFRLD